MHRRILSLALTGFICISIFNFGCTKLDTTNLGSDLIPAVDNVNTFADTFAINATQHVYTDTTLVFSTADQVLGKITNDPLFGQSEGKLFFQLNRHSQKLSWQSDELYRFPLNRMYVMVDFATNLRYHQSPKHNFE